MWSNDCQGFRIETGHVHRVANGAVEQRSANRVRDLNPDALLCFCGGSAEMGSKNKIRGAAQWRFDRERFGFENIQRRTGYLPILQRFQQGVLVDQTPASAVNNPDAAFGFL